MRVSRACVCPGCTAVIITEPRAPELLALRNGVSSCHGGLSAWEGSVLEPGGGGLCALPQQCGAQPSFKPRSSLQPPCAHFTARRSRPRDA